MSRAAPGRDERGFTLVELLLAVAILAIVGAVVSESIIVAFRTTEGSVARISGSIASETLASYFSEDVQSADEVTDPDGTACSTADPAGVFLRLRWSDGGTRLVEYALDPATGPEQDVVRWFCVDGEPPAPRVLGHFSQDETDPPPAAAQCDGADCPADPSLAPVPSEVTLLVRMDDSSVNSVTVRRRTT